MSVCRLVAAAIAVLGCVGTAVAAPAGDYANVADGHPWRHFPVTVAFWGGWQGHDGYRGAVLGAMKQWESVTHGRVRFRTVQGPRANITIRFCNKSKVGYTRTGTAGRWMYHDEIYLGTLTMSGHVISLPHFQADAVHELGHALGIINHSPWREDIMYPVLDDQVVIRARDLATLNKIYRWRE